MTNPTGTEQKILEYIQEYQENYRSSPNAEQIAERLGWTSLGGIRNELRKMEIKGLLAIGVRTRNLTILNSSAKSGAPLR